VEELVTERVKQKEGLHDTAIKLGDERVLQLAKMAGTWLALPLAILFVAGGLFGYSKISDVKEASASAQTTISNLSVGAQLSVSNLSTDAQRTVSNLVGQANYQVRAVASVQAELIAATNQLLGVRKDIERLKQDEQKSRGEFANLLGVLRQDIKMDQLLILLREMEGTECRQNLARDR